MLPRGGAFGGSQTQASRNRFGREWVSRHTADYGIGADEISLTRFKKSYFVGVVMGAVRHVFAEGKLHNLVSRQTPAASGTICPKDKI